MEQQHHQRLFSRNSATFWTCLFSILSSDPFPPAELGGAAHFIFLTQRHGLS